MDVQNRKNSEPRIPNTAALWQETTLTLSLQHTKLRINRGGDYCVGYRIIMTVIPCNDETDEIYCLYGQAAHHCFNIGICCMFLLQGPELRKNHKLGELSPEIIDKIGMELDQSTLGTLLKKLKKHHNLRKHNEIYLEKVLVTRNYLTHKFFGTHGKRMYLPDTWPVMKKELQELLSFLEDASYIFMRWSRINS